MRMKAALACAAIAGLGAIPLLSWGFGGSPATAVRVERPSMRELRPSVFASGEFVHGDAVRITSEVTGKIKAVYINEGQEVARGDLLLEIDSHGYAAQLVHHRAAVRLQEVDIQRKTLAIDQLGRQHRRSEQLHERGLLDAEAFERATHQLRLAEVDLASSTEVLAQAGAALMQSEEQLAKTRVLAPIAGIVASLDIEAGETAVVGTTNVPGSVLIVLASPDSTLAEVYVDEADLAGLRKGQRAAVTPVAYPERPVAGGVDFIATTAKYRPNSRSRSFLVRIGLDDALGQTLRAGMSCRAEIFLAPADEVLSIPIAAIVSADEPATRTTRHFAFVASINSSDDRGAVRRVEIELGRADDEFQEVIAGLAARDHIVVGPSRTLRKLGDGDRIVVEAQ